MRVEQHEAVVEVADPIDLLPAAAIELRAAPEGLRHQLRIGATAALPAAAAAEERYSGIDRCVGRQEQHACIRLAVRVIGDRIGCRAQLETPVRSIVVEIRQPAAERALERLTVWEKVQERLDGAQPRRVHLHEALRERDAADRIRIVQEIIDDETDWPRHSRFP